MLHNVAVAGGWGVCLVLSPIQVNLLREHLIDICTTLCNLVQPEPTVRCTKPIMSGLHSGEQGKVSCLIE